MVSVSVRFTEICLPDYITDYCNRKGECLIGVGLSADMTSESIMSAFMWDVERNDSIPDVVTDAMIREAAENAVSQAGSALAGMVACGALDNRDENSNAQYVDVDALAWFHLTWDLETDEGSK